MEKFDFGMVGLGVMGSNLLLNMADKGLKVAGYDRNTEKIKSLEGAAGEGMVVKGYNTLEEMVSMLKKPRKIMMLVPAGNPVDAVINDLLPLVEAGDIIIDGGNSHYTDTLVRIARLKEKGFHFMGMGISGGEDGARYGPSLMPGGDREAFDNLLPLLKEIAAKVNGEPCVAYMGSDAAGHYVKMVHNGIEYAIMQLISECYDLLLNGCQLDNDELHSVFAQWNTGKMQSFLLQITADIFLRKENGDRLIDKILDRAGAKGTGKWTSEAALEIGMPIPVIDMAVAMRNISSLKEERIQASSLVDFKLQKLDISKDDFVKQLHDALLFSTIISYAQGLALLSKASVELKMNTHLTDVIKVWRGGCIIRSSLLVDFATAFEKNESLENIMLDNAVAGLLQQHYYAASAVVATAIKAGYPVTGMAAALNYYNAYHREKLPANLVQAQRDYFGSHTYERTDKPGSFHTDWTTGEKNDFDR